MSVTTQFDMVGGATRYGFFEDFVGAALNGAWAGTTENSGTAAIAAGREDGQVGLVTGTTSGNRSVLTLDLNYRSDHGGPMVMEAGVTCAALTNVSIFVGWTDNAGLEFPIAISGTTLTTNATDAVGFLFSTAATAATKWQIVSVAGDVDGALTTVNTNLPVATTFQSFRVEVNPDGTAYFFIDGVQVGIGTSLTRTTGRNAAITKTVLMTPIVAVRTETTAAKTVYVDYGYVQKGRWN